MVDFLSSLKVIVTREKEYPEEMDQPSVERNAKTNPVTNKAPTV